MSLLLQYLIIDGIYGILITIVLGTVIYLICLLILKGFTRKEIEFIISFLIKR